MKLKSVGPFPVTDGMDAHQRASLTWALKVFSEGIGLQKMAPEDGDQKQTSFVLKYKIVLRRRTEKR